MFRQATTLSSSRKYNRFALFAGIATFSLALILTFAHVRNVGATGTTFTFGAVGDQGGNSNAVGVLRAIGASQLDFFQSLGDLSYGSDAAVPAWCQLVKDEINVGAGLTAGNAYGENFPFMLATGNHETNQQSNGSDIDTFTQCLPNKFASQSTTSPNVGSGTDNYAKEYFYDYPAVAPLMRMIVASPAIQLNSNGTYTYTAGNAHYQWLSDAIDSARAAGIKWVVVANHKQYITAGSKSDEIGSDYFNLLVSKKVDLILQGHDHSYQRSKQLAIGTGCATVPKSTTNASCIVDDGADNAYTKDAGTVLLISAVGGDNDYNVSAGDSEAGYFAKTMGLNSSNNTYGFTKFNVSDTSISATFVPGVGIDNGFTDSFTISTAAQSGGSDTTAPTVSLTAPAAGATLNATASLTATASDAVGVTKVEFYAGTTKLGEDTTAPYAYDWDTTAVTNGAYSLTAKAYDAADNVSQSSAVAVTVTNDTPATFTVTNKDGVTQSSVKLSGTCTTSTAGSAATTPTQFADKTVLTAVDFTAGCSVAGGSAQVAIDLGKQYTPGNLKVYKDQSDKTIKDITADATIENRTVGSKTTTFVIYTVKDGAAGDTDGAANSSIDDPVYVLDASTTTSNTPTTLAKTGFKLVGLVSIVSLLIAIATETTNRDKRFYSIFRR